MSNSKISPDDYQEPNVNRTTLSIQLPPLKLLKHMIERMKCLSEFVYLEATDSGTLTLKIEADSVSVCTYFRNLMNLPIDGHRDINKTKTDSTILDDTQMDEDTSCSVRLSLKRLHDFVNSLQFQPSQIICNFANNKYAHFFAIYDDDLVLQYLISSVIG